MGTEVMEGGRLPEPEEAVEAPAQAAQPAAPQKPFGLLAYNAARAAGLPPPVPRGPRIDNKSVVPLPKSMRHFRIGRPSPQGVRGETHVKKALKRLEERLGGREKIVQSLLTVDLAPDEERLMHLLADPRRSGRTLRYLCKQAGPDMTPSRALKLLSKAVGAEAFMQANQIIHEGTPKVAADVMARAVPIEEICWPCRGKGKFEAEEGKEAVACNACRGTGRIVILPDLDRQKVALEIAGLLKPKGATQVNVDASSHEANLSILGVVARLRGDTDRVLKVVGAGTVVAQEKE